MLESQTLLPRVVPATSAGEVMRRSSFVSIMLVAALAVPFGAVPAAAATAGPRPITRTPAAPSDIVVTPAQNVAAIVAAAPAGSTIRFRPGVYRMLELQAKDDMRFIGDPGAVLKGSKVLTGWVANGNRWYVGGQTQGSTAPTEGEEWGYCDPGHAACVFPEELFMGGNRLKRVATLAEVGTGKWFFDYAADRIYVGDNPAGRLVETSVARWAVHGQADRVRVEGLIMLQYATPTRQGTVNPRVGRAGAPGVNWQVIGNTILTSHGWAVKIEDGIVITDNTMNWNGQGGVGGVGNDIVVSHNTIRFSCSTGIRCFGFEGGALKIDSDRFVLNYNIVENNWGHGLHPDIMSTDGEIVGNVVRNNEGVGIHYETSSDAVISGNTVTGNGFRKNGTREPGILVLNSFGVDVTGNTVSNNALGILIRQDTRTSRGIVDDVVISGNTVTMGAGQRSGIGQLQYKQIGSVVFSGNTYIHSEASPFVLDGRVQTPTQWRALGFDTAGQFSKV